MLINNQKTVGFFYLGTCLVAGLGANRGYRLNLTYSKKSFVNIDKMLNFMNRRTY
jgi:hypothetical protein